MVIKIFLFCCYLLSTNLQAKTFIMSLHNDLDYTLIHARNTFHLMEDGKFLLKTNTGLYGLCTSSETGKFIGKIDPKLIKAALVRAKDECLNAKKNCSTDTLKSKQFSWRINDYSGEKKATLFFKNDESIPPAIDEIITLISGLQKDAQTSLSLVKKAPDLYQLIYKGQKVIKLPISVQNFFILTKNGTLHSLNQLEKNIAVKETLATLKSGDSIDIKLALSSSNKNGKLIYDSSAGANPEGHSDVQFTPCLPLN